MSEPSWERLRAVDGRALRIAPIRHAAVAELRVVDANLPDHGDATVFDAWAVASGGVVVRAARIRDVDVTPWQLHATRLVVADSDGRLAALLAGTGEVRGGGDLERQACACRGISVDAVVRTVAAGWTTADAVKRATRVGFGSCQGRRCIPWLAGVLERPSDDPLAQITPRPPLVPVPIAVLAAYADD